MSIVTIKQLQQARGYVVVGAFIIAAVVTPPDVVSQFLLAVPLCVLYEIGILLARGIKARPADPKTDPSDSTS
jgi:sec-independent protein translocase protein TatC